MDEHIFGSHDKSQKNKTHDNFDGKIPSLLTAEEHLLQSISNREPLPGILDEICSALDCQIGNVFSLIALPGDDANDLAAMASKAELCGLYAFCSEGIVAENGELLGSLEMYCSVRRSPSSSEIQLIERARCLAAIAIKLDREAESEGHGRARGDRTARGRLLEWPASMNWSSSALSPSSARK